MAATHVPVTWYRSQGCARSGATRSEHAPYAARGFWRNLSSVSGFETASGVLDKTIITPRLWDDATLTFEEKKRFIGYGQNLVINRKLNDFAWKVFTGDKFTFYSLCRVLDIQVLTLQADGALDLYQHASHRGIYEGLLEQMLRHPAER